MRTLVIRVEDRDGKQVRYAEMRLTEQQVESTARLEDLLVAAHETCCQKLDQTPDRFEAVTMRMIGTALPARRIRTK